MQTETCEHCEICSKRIKFVIINCKCKRHLCVKHVFPEAHNCNFDYRQHAREILNNKNPIVVSKKVEKI